MTATSPDDMVFEIALPELQIENEIAAGMNQTQIAQTYALALRVRSYEPDWARINKAIMKRWPKGLKRIKEMAHSGKCFKKEQA